MGTAKQLIAVQLMTRDSKFVTSRINQIKVEI
jgi:hypothetical protein